MIARRQSSEESWAISLTLRDYLQDTCSRKSSEACCLIVIYGGALVSFSIFRPQIDNKAIETEFLQSVLVKDSGASECSVDLY